MTSTTAGATRFDSLEAMKARHIELMRTNPPGASPADIRARILEFISRGTATGVVLDNPADRRVAQGLIDYWKATLYTQFRDGEPEPASPAPVTTVLADFPEMDSEQLSARAEAAVVSLDPPDREVARRILLRLVRLPPAVREFQPNPVARAALDDTGNVGQVVRVIHSLTSVGVLRRSPGTQPGDERVELAAAHLVRTWPRYAGWLKDRLALRTAAYLWQEHNRHPSGLVAGPPLAEAAAFQDRDALETEFIDASRDSSERKRKIRLWAGIGLLLTAIVVLIALIVQERNRRRIAEQKQKFAEQASLSEQAFKDLQGKQGAISARVTNINRMMRGLSEIVVADTPDDEKLTKWRWEQMYDEVRTDPEINAVLQSQEQNLKRLLTAKGRVDKGRAALAIAHAMRNHSLNPKDEWVYVMMKSVREVTYHTAQEVTKELVEAARKKRTPAEMEAYDREFWRLYWGPLGMVEGPKVEAAMFAFGRELNTWKTWPPGKKEGWDDMMERLVNAQKNLAKAFEEDLNLPIELHRPQKR